MDRKGQEAPTSLMLAVTAEATNSDGFCRAVAMSLSLLKEVEQRYLYDHWWPPESQRFTIHMEHDDLKAVLAEELGESFLERGSGIRCQLKRRRDRGKCGLRDVTSRSSPLH
ncbi:hypothetical protein AK812_SmicGene23583 [Symbiodinium microadriaticum]|uniref:Uncharacterized protein n=1 Tax=Symbiodinium microadriaticum TaxID=2951 RepID=A0A1Q9DGX0_SYMMI|nr:hypothetical protein AK812_SmicGene23583 [Symbiodinium microadriaticum]